MRHDWNNEALYKQTRIDPWFLWQIRSLVEEEGIIIKTTFSEITPVLLKNWKQRGFSDQRIEELLEGTLMIAFAIGATDSGKKLSYKSLLIPSKTPTEINSYSSNDLYFSSSFK